MKDKNYDKLRDALDRLPEYDPAAARWDSIANALNRQAVKASATPLGGRLPTYAPPAEVWNTVSHALDVEAKPRRLKMSWSARTAGIAAALALAVSLALGILLADRGPKVTYTYSQEEMSAPVVADWDNEDESFDRARREVEARNEPHLNNLGNELDELNAAREEVKAMLVAYGEDPQVIRQLAEIERERDDVYRRIIVEL